MAADRPIIFHGVEHLLEGIVSFKESNDWVYVNRQEFKADLTSCLYYYLPEDWILSLDEQDLYLDEDGLEMPRLVEGLALTGWRLASDLSLLASEANRCEDPLVMFANELRNRWK